MVGMQADTMPRFGSAVDHTETIPNDPAMYVRPIADRYSMIDQESLTCSIHGRISNELNQPD